MGETRGRQRQEAHPQGCGGVSFESTETIIRLLTSENRRLPAIIRDKEPKSIRELSALTGRAQPNPTRTLAKLEAAGLVKSQTHGKRKTLTVEIKKITFETDPFSDKDTLRVA